MRLFLLISFILLTFQALADDWKLMVETKNTAISKVYWQSDKKTQEALSADLLLLLKGNSSLLIRSEKYMHALMLLPKGTKPGGLFGDVALLVPGGIVAKGCLDRSPEQFALGPGGFYYVLTQGNRVTMGFYHLRESNPREVFVSENRARLLSEQEKRQGRPVLLREILSVAETGAVFKKGNQRHIYRPEGQTDVEFLFEPLSKKEIEAIRAKPFLGDDLTENAKTKGLRPNHREQELSKEIGRLFLSPTRKNVLLYGEPGVDLLGVVHEVATQIAENQIAGLEDWRVVEIPINAFNPDELVGGGNKKLIELFNRLRFKKVILVFTGFDQILRIGGDAESSGNDVVSSLLNYLERGESLVFGTTSSQGYASLSTKKDLMALFHARKVEEPNGEKLLAMLEDHGKKVAAGKDIAFNPLFLRQVVAQSTRYWPELKQPEKGFRILDDIAQRCASAGNPRIPITQIGDSIGRLTGKFVMTQQGWNHFQEYLRGTKFEDSMKVYLGQKNVKAFFKGILELIASNFTGLVPENEVNRPTPPAVLMLGASGTGKTFFVEALSKAMVRNNIPWDITRLDGNTFQVEGMSTTRVSGSAPGYVGYEKGAGYLYKVIKSIPQHIFFIDEFDKTAPDFRREILEFLEKGEAVDGNTRDVAHFFGLTILASNYGSIPETDIGSRFTCDYVDRWDAFKMKLAEPETEEDKEIASWTEAQLMTQLLERLRTTGALTDQVARRVHLVIVHHHPKESVHAFIRLKVEGYSEKYQGLFEAKVKLAEAVENWLVDLVWDITGQPTFRQGLSAIIKKLQLLVEPKLNRFALNEGEKHRNQVWEVYLENAQEGTVGVRAFAKEAP